MERMENCGKMKIKRFLIPQLDGGGYDIDDDYAAVDEASESESETFSDSSEDKTSSEGENNDKKNSPVSIRRRASLRKSPIASSKTTPTKRITRQQGKMKGRNRISSNAAKHDKQGHPAEPSTSRRQVENKLAKAKNSRKTSMNVDIEEKRSVNPIGTQLLDCSQNSVDEEDGKFVCTKCKKGFDSKSSQQSHAYWCESSRFTRSKTGDVKTPSNISTSKPKNQKSNKTEAKPIVSVSSSGSTPTPTLPRKVGRPKKIRHEEQPAPPIYHNVDIKTNLSSNHSPLATLEKQVCFISESETGCLKSDAKHCIVVNPDPDVNSSCCSPIAVLPTDKGKGIEVEEPPVDCPKCKMTYRNLSSLQKHLPNCNDSSSCSSSSSDEDEQQELVNSFNNCQEEYAVEQPIISNSGQQQIRIPDEPGSSGIQRLQQLSSQVSQIEISQPSMSQNVDKKTENIRNKCGPNLSLKTSARNIPTAENNSTKLVYTSVSTPIPSFHLSTPTSDALGTPFQLSVINSIVSPAITSTSHSLSSSVPVAPLSEFPIATSEDQKHFSNFITLQDSITGQLYRINIPHSGSTSIAPSNSQFSGVPQYDQSISTGISHQYYSPQMQLGPGAHAHAQTPPEGVQYHNYLAPSSNAQTEMLMQKLNSNSQHRSLVQAAHQNVSSIGNYPGQFQLPYAQQLQQQLHQLQLPHLAHLNMSMPSMLPSHGNEPSEPEAYSRDVSLQDPFHTSMISQLQPQPQHFSQLANTQTQPNLSTMTEQQKLMLSSRYGSQLPIITHQNHLNLQAHPYQSLTQYPENMNQQINISTQSARQIKHQNYVQPSELSSMLMHQTTHANGPYVQPPQLYTDSSTTAQLQHSLAMQYPFQYQNQHQTVPSIQTFQALRNLQNPQASQAQIFSQQFQNSAVPFRSEIQDVSGTKTFSDPFSLSQTSQPQTQSTHQSHQLLQNQNSVETQHQHVRVHQSHVLPDLQNPVQGSVQEAYRKISIPSSAYMHGREAPVELSAPKSHQQTLSSSCSTLFQQSQNYDSQHLQAAPAPVSEFQFQGIQFQQNQLSNIVLQQQTLSPSKISLNQNIYANVVDKYRKVLPLPFPRPIEPKPEESICSTSTTVGVSESGLSSPSLAPSPSVKKTYNKSVKTQLANMILERHGVSLTLNTEGKSNTVGGTNQNFSVQNSIDRHHMNSSDSHSNSGTNNTCKQVRKNPILTAVVRPMEHPLQKLSDQISQIESTFNSQPAVVRPPLNSTPIPLGLVPIQESSDQGDTATSSESLNQNAIAQPFLSARVRPLIPSKRAGIVKTNPCAPIASSGSPAKSIKVTLKRKERGDSYSIKDVIETGGEGAPSIMRRLKINSKILSGESAGTATVLEVEPRIHLIPIPHPNPDADDLDSNLTIEEGGPVANSGSNPAPKLTHRAVVVYEVISGSTVIFRSCDVRAVWSHIFETSQGTRLNQYLPPLSYPATTISVGVSKFSQFPLRVYVSLVQVSDTTFYTTFPIYGLENKKETSNEFNMYGLKHRAVQFLLQNIRNRDTAKHKQFHDPGLLDEEVKVNETGCARAEGYTGRKPFDMFGWLASKHRKPLERIPSFEEISKPNGMPITQRYRTLKEKTEKTLVVMWSTIHGRGLYTTRVIEKGDKIIKYAGEVIRSPVCDQREKYYETKGIGCYMFRINDEYVIDATMKGNAARFINHSCEPNCESKSVRISGQQEHIQISALRTISIGEELTYDYKFEKEEDKIPCTCGSKKCRKYLN